MSNEQKLLLSMITEAQYMMVFNDLTRLPKVLFFLEKYAFINNVKLTIKSRDLENLKDYNMLYKL